VKDEAEVLVLLSGIDETFAQTVHARSSYRAEEILWNRRFRSIFVQEQGKSLSVDISGLDDIEET
jgi:inward rectifier potassium channel